MADEAQPQPTHKRGGSPFAWLLVLLLFGAVFWLVSERNARKLFLTVENGQLTVSRGRFFPTGTRSVEGEPDLGKAYAPVPVPAGQKVADQEFDDRTQLDRTLFDLLVPWAKGAAAKPDAASQAQAMALADRASELHGLSAQQLEQLNTLRGDLAFTAALGELSVVGSQIESARQRMIQAHDRGGTRALEAMNLADELGRMEARLSEMSKAAPAPVPASAQRPALAAAPAGAQPDAGSAAIAGAPQPAGAEGTAQPGAGATGLDGGSAASAAPDGGAR